MAIPRELAFAPSEFEARLAAVRRNMLDRELDVLILLSPANINYVSGMDNQNVSDFQCLIVPLDGPSTLILPWFEQGRAENSCWLRDIVTHRAEDDPSDVIRSVLRRMGVDRGRIGLESRGVAVSPRDYSRITSRLADATVEDPFGVVEDCRRVKSASEIAYIRQAAELTDRTIAAACDAIRVGVRDTDVASATLAALYRAGSCPVFHVPYIASGYRAGAPHSTFSGRTFAPGDTVFLELTAAVKRYVAPLMHTVVLGEPTPQMKRMATAGDEAVEVILDTARPGVPACEVARAALNVLEPVLTQDNVFFHHNFGYPVGIEYPPTWIENLDYFIKLDNPAPLQAGMVFHLPISLRRFGEFGINQSHTMLVTESGAEALTRTPARLQILEG